MKNVEARVCYLYKPKISSYQTYIPRATLIYHCVSFSRVFVVVVVIIIIIILVEFVLVGTYIANV